LDLVTAAGAGGSPHVRVLNIAPFAEIASVLVGDVIDPNGLFVA